MAQWQGDSLHPTPFKFPSQNLSDDNLHPFSFLLLNVKSFTSFYKEIVKSLNRVFFISLLDKYCKYSKYL
ncbi:MAG: hypothetical protein WAQ98_21380 [Blastocatellia bacterium]